MILAYARCSSKDQKDGTSLGEQERRLRAFATARGAESFDFVLYTDPDISGSTPLKNRPAGGKLLADASKGDFIVALKIDRMFRNVLDALTVAKELKDKKIDLAFGDFMGAEPVTGDGLAQCFFTVATAFAQLERDKINERTEDGRRAKKAAQGCIGGVPYGFKKIGHGRDSILEPLDKEQQVIKLARELSGNMTPWGVSRQLNERGIRTRTGNAWQTVQVQRLLNSGASG
mgnify:CR=1 FL=1